MARTITGPFARHARQVIIADGVRTPFGRSHPENGWFREVHPNAMLATVYAALLTRAGLEPADIEDLHVGCTAPFGEQSRNIGRNAWLHAGYPPEIPAVTMDRRCGSAQTAAETAAGLIGTGTHDLVIAAGVEHMHHVPMNSPAKIAELFGEPWTAPMWEQYDFVHQGESAELIAHRWGISRDEMDSFAAQSHQRAAAAGDAGRFDDEIIAMELGGAIRTGDQSVRPETTVETLAGLRPAFRADGSITAGSSSPICDGAAGVLLASPEAASAHGLRARARVVDQTTVGVDPIIMLTGPIPATQKILQRNGLTMADIDLFEVNEAFASVVIAWQRELAADLDKVNVNGGAIGLGHPVGATGARLLATIVGELERRDAELGLVTMCCGGGMGTATLVQRI